MSDLTDNQRNEMTTTSELMTRADLVCAVADPVADIEVPVLSGPQRQGDVGVWPTNLTDAEVSQCEPVPPAGVQVVSGEATGNTHLLLADSDVRWQPRTAGVELGVLVVADGSVAHLIHTDEHAAVSIAPGTYRLRGKRELADEIRRVAD